MKYLILFCLICTAEIQSLNTSDDRSFRNSYDEPLNIPLHLWPNGNINYYFDVKFPEKARQTFRGAVKEINLNTCVKFNEIGKAAADAVMVKEHSKGCVSTMGRHLTENTIKVNSKVCQEGHMIHQLIHVLGLPHEHERPDRDNHLRVAWENVKPGVENFLQKHSNLNGVDLVVPYGFNSITHLPASCCSKNGKDVFVSNRHGALLLIGQRYLLELFDIMKINRLYHCKESSYYLGTDLFVLPDNWHEPEKYKYEPVKGKKLISETEIPGLPNGGGVFPKSECICGYESFVDKPN